MNMDGGWKGKKKKDSGSGQGWRITTKRKSHIGIPV